MPFTLFFPLKSTNLLEKRADKIIMNNENCEACQALGILKEGKHLDAIYHPQGGSSYLRLCYSHSIELFRYGQTFFVGKYKPEDKDSSGIKNCDRLTNYFVFSAER